MPCALFLLLNNVPCPSTGGIGSVGVRDYLFTIEEYNNPFHKNLPDEIISNKVKTISLQKTIIIRLSDKIYLSVSQISVGQEPFQRLHSFSSSITFVSGLPSC